MLLNLFYIRKVFLEGTSKSSTVFFTVYSAARPEHHLNVFITLDPNFILVHTTCKEKKFQWGCCTENNEEEIMKKTNFSRIEKTKNRECRKISGKKSASSKKNSLDSDFDGRFSFWQKVKGILLTWDKF